MLDRWRSLIIEACKIHFATRSYSFASNFVGNEPSFLAGRKFINPFLIAHTAEYEKGQTVLTISAHSANVFGPDFTHAIPTHVKICG